MRRAVSVLAVLALAAQAACRGCARAPAGETGPVAGDAGASAGDTAENVPGDGASDDGGSDAPAVSATLSGTVTVALYRTDADGVRRSVSWEEATGGTFPYGAIWVTAYTVDDADGQVYRGSDTIAHPSTEPNGYALEAGLDAPGEVWLYAALDQGRDGIVQPTDPIGIHPEAVQVEDGVELDGLDITILVSADALAWGDTGWSTGGDGGGWGTGSGCDDVTISGPVTITADWTGGPGIAVLSSATAFEPYDWDWFTPTPTADGAESAYAIATCAGLGTMNLLAVYDSNGNSLIDPADQWGGWVDGDGADANPVEVGSEDLPDHAIRIPTGEGEGGLEVLPFVELSGTVTVEDGTFDDLPSGTGVTVAALRYRPGEDLTASEVASQAYDSRSWDWADLEGTASRDFSLYVPASTVVYLWAFADTDGDGVVNESGEPVASGGEDDAGTVHVDTTASAGHTLPLATAQAR